MVDMSTVTWGGFHGNRGSNISYADANPCVVILARIDLREDGNDLTIDKVRLGVAINLTRWLTPKIKFWR